MDELKIEDANDVCDICYKTNQNITLYVLKDRVITLCLTHRRELIKKLEDLKDE